MSTLDREAVLALLRQVGARLQAQGVTASMPHPSTSSP